MGSRRCKFLTILLGAITSRTSFAATCPVGKLYDAASARCRCPPGTYRSGVQCTACETGRYTSQADAASCADCPSGSVTPRAATACCPSDSHDWPVTHTVTLNLPPGRVWTSVYQISGCEDNAIPDAALIEPAPVSQSKVNGTLRLATVIRGKDLHSCKAFLCTGGMCKLVAPDTDEFMPGLFLKVAAYVEVHDACSNGQCSSVSQQCAQQARVGFSGFGCEEGTVLAFLGALICVISGTIILGLIFEYLFRRHADFFVQAGMKITPARSDGNANTKEPPAALWPLPTLRDLHEDVQGALIQNVALSGFSLPFSHFFGWSSGWSSGQEEKEKARAVQLEFRIPRKFLPEVDALRKELLSLSWLPGRSWATSNVVVESQLPACVKEMGALPGADLFDAIEGAVVKCLSCCSGSGPCPSDEQLYLQAARQVLAMLMTRRMAFAIALQTVVNMGMIMALPAAAAASMTCEDGFPWSIHGVWGVYVLFSSLFGIWIIIRPLLYSSSKQVLTAFIKKFRVRLALRFVGMIVSVTDLYQDTSFPVIAGVCGFDLWWVSLWLVFLGVGIMQILVQLVLIFNCWRRYKRARTAEERERIHIEGLFLALRGCDNHVLVYAAKPAIEERLGGASSWAIKTVEARVAFLRFCFEDAEQSALQVIFLYWFENASFKDKLWVAFSVSTSLLLSFTLTVQTLPEARDWIWYQFLTAFPGAQRLHRLRFLWLFVIIVLYRLFSVLPWLGACTPAGDHDDSAMQRLLLLKEVPPTVVILEVFAGCAIAFVVTVFMTTVSACVWNKPLGLSRRWHQWRGTGRYGPTGAAGRRHDFSERLVADETLHLKTEQDEDTWLTPLRAINAGCSAPAKNLLEDIDSLTFELARSPGLSSSIFAERREHVLKSLDDLKGLGVPAEPLKALDAEVKRSMTCAAVRQRALELLADRTFRKANLSLKAHLIDEATNGLLPLQILHWSTLAKLKQLPRCGAKGPGAVSVTEALQQHNQDRIVLVYLSHSWMRPNHPDSEKHLKARTMVQFAQWLRAKAARHRLLCEVYFWVDYSCIDTEVELEIGIAALPLFVAACTDILTWRTPDYESRCWAMVERLLAYCFCPGGLTPYAVNGNSFGLEEILESKEDPSEAELDKDFGQIYREITTPAKRAQTVPLDGGETEVMRFIRKLPDPLDSMAVRPSGHAASARRRQLYQLVDMALAVPALEIFGDRQPVDFGLTEVVEQVLGNHTPLESGFSGDGKQKVTVAWKEPIDVPEEVGKWLTLRPAEVEVVEWRLVVELPNDKPHRSQSFYRPGDDEGVITLVDAGHVEGDAPPTSPGAEVIDRLFGEVNAAHEDHLRGGVDPNRLEKAAMALAKALQADLRAALHAADGDAADPRDAESALRQAITRTRTSELPEKQYALERLCAMQLDKAAAAKDIVGIRMAMRYARLQSLEGLPAYSAAEAALAYLQVEKLRENALSVVHDDGADPHSIVSVIGVAKQRGWDDIAKEALGALEARIVDSTGNISIDALLRICSTGENLSVDAVAAMTNSIALRLLEDMKKTNRGPDLVVFIQKWRKWHLKHEVESEALVALQGIIDHRKENCREGAWNEATYDLSRISDSAKGDNVTDDLFAMAVAALDHVMKVQNAEKNRVRTSMINTKPAPPPGKLSEAMKIAKAWGWDDIIKEIEGAFTSLVRSAAKQKPSTAVSELSEISIAAGEHSLDSVLAETKTAFASCLKQVKDAKDPILLMQMLNDAEEKGCIEFAGQIRPVLWDVVAYFKDSDLADAEETLQGLHQKAEELGRAEIAELAGEAAGVAAAKEEEKRAEAKNLLMAATNMSAVVETLGLASRRGWDDIVTLAQDTMKFKLGSVEYPMTVEVLTEMAQAYHLAQKKHVHAGVKPLKGALADHKDFLLRDSDAAGVLHMILILEEANCGKVADEAKETLNHNFVEYWKKGSCLKPRAEDLRDAAREAGEPWLALADEIHRMLRLEESFEQAKRDQDVAQLGVAALAALNHGHTGDGCSLYEQAVRALTNIFEAWKSAGYDEQPSTADLDMLLRASMQCKAKALSARIGKVHAVAHDLEELKKKLEEKTKLEALSPGLIKVVSTGEKLGCAHIARGARESLKRLVKLLEKDINEESNTKALQELHDVARRQKLDDIADLAVDAVGGNLPKDWVTNGSKRLSLLEKIPLKDDELIARIQELVNATYRGWGKLGADCSTRDRYKLGNPQGASLKVEQVVHVENAANYLNFMQRRRVVENEFKALTDKGRDPHIKTWQVSFQGLRRYPTDPVEKGLNECWLWHGTSEAGVNGITDTDFDMSRAGKHVGTMFGRGIYFTESALKADEYTKPDSRGLSPMLLCRVTLGHYYYCDAKAPWDMTETLEKACKPGGGYHSILGDRERVRGTYREFIVFDNDQIYPEYIVWYSRNPPFKEGTVPK